MNVSSRLATGRVLAIILTITLVGFGVNAIQLTAQSNQCCQPPAPVVQIQPEPTCCPVDPKAEAHAAHEAEEDAARAQKEAEHAQHEAAEDCERNQKKLAHAQHELAEEQEKVNELSTFCPTNTCPVAEAPISEVIIERAKPEPEVEVFVEPAPAPLPEPAPIVTPAPTPEPPKELPKTASSMDLLGLIGLLSAAGYSTRFFRR